MIDDTSVWVAESDTDFSDFSGQQPPKKLMFSLTGKCNLRCDHCPRAHFEIVAEQTPKELIDHVVDHLLHSIRAVRLGGTDLGEQLTAKYFNYFLERVLEHPRLELEIVSNLTLMDEEKANLLARACTQFYFSLEGIGGSFEANRHFPWSVVETNLKQLNKERARVTGSRLKIGALVTCYYENLDQLVPILDLADLGVDHFTYRPFVPNTEEQRSQCLEYHKGEAEEVLDRLKDVATERGIQVGGLVRVPLPGLPAEPDRVVERPQETVPMGAPTKDRAWICQFPFETVSVLSDGEVRTCCEAIRLGELALDRGASIQDIWTGREWSSLRRSVATGRWTGPCEECGHRRSQEARLRGD